jgi:glycine oxidase
MISPEVVSAAAEFAQALLDARVRDADGFAAWRDAARWPALYHRAGAAQYGKTVDLTTVTER